MLVDDESLGPGKTPRSRGLDQGRELGWVCVVLNELQMPLDVQVRQGKQRVCMYMCIDVNYSGAARLVGNSLYKQNVCALER